MLIFLIKKRQIDTIMKIDIGIYCIQFLIHLKLVLSNPGVLPITKNIHERKGKDKYCDKCNIYATKKDELYHCIICGICISQSDHHCAWISKCVGRNNYLSHNIFILLVLSYLLLTIVLFFH